MELTEENVIKVLEELLPFVAIGILSCGCDHSDEISSPLWEPTNTFLMFLVKSSNMVIKE